MAIKSLISKIIPIFDLPWYLLDNFQDFCIIIESSREIYS